MGSLGDGSIGVTRIDPRLVELMLEPIGGTTGPMAGAATVAELPGLEVGVWEHSAGASADVEEDEVFVVISGRCTVFGDDDAGVDFGPGDVGVFRSGTRTRWEVHEAVRKVYVTGRKP